MFFYIRCALEKESLIDFPNKTLYSFIFLTTIILVFISMFLFNTPNIVIICTYFTIFLGFYFCFRWNPTRYNTFIEDNQKITEEDIYLFYLNYGINQLNNLLKLLDNEKINIIAKDINKFQFKVITIEEISYLLNIVNKLKIQLKQIENSMVKTQIENFLEQLFLYIPPIDTYKFQNIAIQSALDNNISLKTITNTTKNILYQKKLDLLILLQITNIFTNNLTGSSIEISSLENLKKMISSLLTTINDGDNSTDKFEFESKKIESSGINQSFFPLPVCSSKNRKDILNNFLNFYEIYKFFIFYNGFSLNFDNIIDNTIENNGINLNNNIKQSTFSYQNIDVLIFKNSGTVENIQIYENKLLKENIYFLNNYPIFFVGNSYIILFDNGALQLTRENQTFRANKILISNNILLENIYQYNFYKSPNVYIDFAKNILQIKNNLFKYY